MKKGFWILGFIGVFVFIVYLFLGKGFIYQFMFWSPKYSSTACVRSGGRWTSPPMPLGVPKTYGQCYYPPKDEGRECYKNSECEKDCVSTGKTDKDGYILGKCGEYSVFDCVPTIPSKTKDHKDLKGGSCV